MSYLCQTLPSTETILCDGVAWGIWMCNSWLYNDKNAILFYSFLFYSLCTCIWIDLYMGVGERGKGGGRGCLYPHLQPVQSHSSFNMPPWTLHTHFQDSCFLDRWACGHSRWLLWVCLFVQVQGGEDGNYKGRKRNAGECEQPEQK